jgi:hypothetical protein
VLSLTGDCFMQAPFYKVQGADREALLKDLRSSVITSGSGKREDKRSPILFLTGDCSGFG